MACYIIPRYGMIIFMLLEGKFKKYELIFYPLQISWFEA
jgi:hypothetical protein